MLSVQTPAKINLFLNIQSPRPDGYHEICSVIQAIQLWDQLDVSPREDEEKDIAFSCNVPALEEDIHQNLVVKAYQAFWRYTGKPKLGLNVHLEKGIPMQAGLGGGSSDAAAMLVVLNHLTHAGLSEDKLWEVAANLGSDVPFFISGGLALVSGRGEIVEPLPANLVEAMSLVIVKPLFINVDTSVAYQHFATNARYESRSPEHLLNALKEGKVSRGIRDEMELSSYLFNDFERVLFPQYPEMAQIAKTMKEVGIRKPLLSGSGSAMFGFAESSPALRQAMAQAFPKNQYEIYWSQTFSGNVTQTS